MITCTKCKESKSSEHFYKQKDKRNGLSSACKKCHSTYRPDKARKAYNDKKHYLKRVYGVTKEEYEELMSTSNKCQKCGVTDNLCYDHNHTKTGKEAFRGVLCSSCNRAIGQLGDTLEGIEEASNYLRKYYGKR